jgi:hypothetical protein
MGVVCRCHGFKTGFKIACGAVVEQVHSLGVAHVCAQLIRDVVERTAGVVIRLR